MATTTVVCPECGAAAAPGRFACPDCGALVASLGAVAKPARPATRRASRRPAAGSTAGDPDDAPLGATVETVIDPDDELLGRAVAVPAVEPLALEPDDDPYEPAEPAERPAEVPVAAVEPQWPTAPVEPQWPTAPVEPQWPTARTEPQWPSAPVVPDWRTPVDPPESAEDVDDSRPLAMSAAPSTIPPVVDRPSVAAPPVVAEPPSPPPDLPVWPPAGGPAPLPAPLSAPPVRTPAGAYLAPSAVLPPLDAPNAPSGNQDASATGPATAPDGKPRVASLAETLDALGITGNVPRRVIGSGAALAALGFLLPWADVVIGSGQVGSYWARWGMAGPGHWIIVAILIVIAALGLTRGRLSGLPLGVPALALGALLVGLVWPYLFGVIGHSVGVWLVLVGAVLVAVGGFLDLRRHATATPDV